MTTTTLEKPAPSILPTVVDARKRYVLCGLSVRAINHFVLPLTGLTGLEHGNDLRDCANLTAVLDIDARRMADFKQKTGANLAAYLPNDFDRMIAEQRPDVVLIAGPDFTHFEYILKALRSGCDVIVEKPMVLTKEEAIQVIKAEKETNQRVTVTFNMRYKPLQCAVRRLLMEKTIGRVVNVDFTYNLDTEHGSSYFFRWNRKRSWSGGLNIHKSCHHLDVINWWLDDVPQTVFAFGDLNYYGPKGAHRPLDESGQPLSLTETKENCPYYKKHFATQNELSAKRVTLGMDRFKLPYDAQYPPEDPSYLYDDEIDIEDTYGALVRYRGGAILNYSINFSAPWEGFNLGINGTHGRIEASQRRSAIAVPGENGASARGRNRIEVLPLFGQPYTLEIEEGLGSHGGADAPHQRDLFRQQSRESRELGLMADSVAGAYAVAAGEAIWLSSSSGQPISIPRFEDINGVSA